MTQNVTNSPRGFFLNAERTGGGVRITVGAIIAVKEITESEILLISHGARVRVIGEKLELSVFEERAVEVNGKIREVVFLYGKN